MAASISPLAFTDSGRQSPFRRQNSASPATVRATTPTISPTKATPSLSLTKNGSLSPEKGSPFVRRPSQISNTGERPSSPFARPSSGLSIPASPSRQVSNTSNFSRREETPASPRVLPSSPRRSTPTSPRLPTLEREETPRFSPPTPSRDISDFDGPAADSPSTALPSQANLRPTTPRIPTSSTVSTVKAPLFHTATTSKATTTRPPLPRGFSNTASVGNYTHLPPSLLRTLRESFEVLDSINSGTLAPASVTTMLEQMGMDNSPHTLKDFFPPGAPQHLNLARYLDTLSAPLAALSPPEELAAAFEAWDRDDSGQIDFVELREALVHTARAPGGEQGSGMMRMSEREVEGVLGEFAGRRQFGARGVGGGGGKGKGKEEVFRWREFMAGIRGGHAAEVEAGVEEAVGA